MHPAAVPDADVTRRRHAVNPRRVGKLRVRLSKSQLLPPGIWHEQIIGARGSVGRARLCMRGRASRLSPRAFEERDSPERTLVRDQQPGGHAADLVGGEHDVAHNNAERARQDGDRCRRCVHNRRLLPQGVATARTSCSYVILSGPTASVIASVRPSAVSRSPASWSRPSPSCARPRQPRSCSGLRSATNSVPRKGEAAPAGTPAGSSRRHRLAESPREH
jgi:hypothetical protein